MTFNLLHPENMLIFTVSFYPWTVTRKKQKRCKGTKLTVKTCFIHNSCAVECSSYKDMVNQKATSRDFRLKLLLEDDRVVHLKRNSHFRRKSDLFRSTRTTTELCDEFQLTLPFEFADDGVQEGVLVRHMTASDGHGSERRCSANRLFSCGRKLPFHFGDFAVDLLQGWGGEPLLSSLQFCALIGPGRVWLRANQRSATQLNYKSTLKLEPHLKQRISFWLFSWLFLWCFCVISYLGF